ncbi:hypothetical protein [Bdellovibrio sp. KM01]|uniref:hypothetical protein n=1 Tax=Bdellovibrio sp. KM01 TaxID=2748865 RepID=UPI0015EA679C|nr:hypothetical protein [Bdellovibrio sp. KM01]QLY25256.1 hypothetical protein HW988_17855 [Bdellovibrio sp. KM01]
MSTKVTESHWDQNGKILFTSLKGNVDEADIFAWKHTLSVAVASIPTNTEFKVLLDLNGFDPVSISAHKAMRNVIPELLATHGLRPAFIDLFDEKPEMIISCDDGKRCTAFANVHHDPNKMADYRKRIGGDRQQFFTDKDQAAQWLNGLA